MGKTVKAVSRPVKHHVPAGLGCVHGASTTPNALSLEVDTMRIARFVGAAALGLGLAASLGMADAMAQSGLAAYQGAWLAGDMDCAEIYSTAGKGASFKRPVNIFAPAFVISGDRLRTPQASCSIRSVRPSGDRQLLLLNCANAVAGNAVRVLMAPQPGGSLRRYFNEQDSVGTEYRRCSR
jgi:hypothetical protein